MKFQNQNHQDHLPLQRKIGHNPLQQIRNETFIFKTKVHSIQVSFPIYVYLSMFLKICNKYEKY